MILHCTYSAGRAGTWINFRRRSGSCLRILFSVFFGISQDDCGRQFPEGLIRGFLAVMCRVFGRPFVIRLISPGQKKLPEEYDVAISYLQNGRLQSLYGGTNEFVLKKITAREKIAFLHCDYCNCGANNPKNNKLYDSLTRSLRVLMGAADLL